MSIKHSISDIEAKIHLALEALDLAAHFAGEWGRHPRYDPDAWYLEVSSELTRLGYWEWVATRLDEGDPDDIDYRRLPTS